MIARSCALRSAARLSSTMFVRCRPRGAPPPGSSPSAAYFPTKREFEALLRAYLKASHGRYGRPASLREDSGRAGQGKGHLVKRALWPAIRSFSVPGTWHRRGIRYAIPSCEKAGYPPHGGRSLRPSSEPPGACGAASPSPQEGAHRESAYPARYTRRCADDRLQGAAAFPAIMKHRDLDGESAKLLASSYVNALRVLLPGATDEELETTVRDGHTRGVAIGLSRVMERVVHEKPPSEEREAATKVVLQVEALDESYRNVVDDEALSILRSRANGRPASEQR